MKVADDTIAATSTPPGEGGIGIVRLSGPQSIAIVTSFFLPNKWGQTPIISEVPNSRSRQPYEIIGVCPHLFGARRVFYGHVIDEEGAVVDEVLVHVMRAPHSYTREDVVEINCHGGAGPLNSVLELALRHGARLAHPGEFTQRAFLNGRIDLVQAEAVIDRIQARTKASLRAASAAAGGALSKAIHEMNAALVNALAQIEAAIDFPDEDLPELVTPGLKRELQTMLERMRDLLKTAEAGRLYREGAAIAIAGRPNVGKSSLFNALLRDSRAIVSAQPGTTRDRIEELITIAGIPVRLTDTAGLRSTRDEVEQIGIRVARDAVKTADIILFVLDTSVALTHEDEDLAEELKELGFPVWVVLNKMDITVEFYTPGWLDNFNGSSKVSAKTGKGIEELEKRVAALLMGAAPIAPDQGMITRAHQRESLRRAALALENLLQNYAIGTASSPELLSIDLREAINALGEITGETTPEDILDKIFSSFCIGK